MKTETRRDPAQDEAICWWTVMLCSSSDIFVVFFYRNFLSSLWLKIDYLLYFFDCFLFAQLYSKVTLLQNSSCLLCFSTCLWFSLDLRLADRLWPVRLAERERAGWRISSCSDARGRGRCPGATGSGPQLVCSEPETSISVFLGSTVVQHDLTATFQLKDFFSNLIILRLQLHSKVFKSRTFIEIIQWAGTTLTAINELKIFLLQLWTRTLWHLFNFKDWSSHYSI